jgi:ribosome biogenesis protein BRX1
MERNSENKNKFLNKKTKREEEKPEKKEIVEQSKFYKDEIEENLDKEENVNHNSKNKLKVNSTSSGGWINKQRTLVVASRGVSHQERYLVNDIISMLPHSKKECKIEKSVAKDELNEICFNHSCKNGLYFEHRKRELVLWMFRSPEGPCAKFQVRNVHTLSEIKLSGNCLKYSRPLLSFDKSFDELPHLKLMKELFKHTFNSPKNHPKTKPFYDHIICFYNVNNHIFFRNYQILNELKERFCEGDDTEKLQLSEIGPRFSLNLIRIFEGSAGGKTLYTNPFYMSPTILVRKNADKFKLRKLKQEKEKEVLNEKMSKKFDTNHKWLQEADN